MKTLKTLVLVGAALLAVVAGGFAQVNLPFGHFSASSAASCRRGGNYGTTNYWAVVPAFAPFSSGAASTDDGYAPVVNWLSWVNDKAGGAITFYTPGTNAPVTVVSNAIAATNVVYVASTNNNWTAGDKLIVEHRAGPKPTAYEYFILGSATTTALTLNSNLVYAVSLGDVIYKVQQNSKVVVGASSTNSSGSFFVGHRNMPALIEMDSTTTASLNGVSGYYGR